MGNGGTTEKEKEPIEKGIYDLSGNASEILDYQFGRIQKDSIPLFFKSREDLYDSVFVAGGNYMEDSLNLSIGKLIAVAKEETDSTVGFRIVQTYLGLSSDVEF